MQGGKVLVLLSSIAKMGVGYITRQDNDLLKKNSNF